jgi:SAM-dependent methyltransferase
MPHRLASEIASNSLAPRGRLWWHGAMESYGPATYGDHIADLYDDRYAQRDPQAEVARIAGLAGSGPVLELGIGTGRTALPLAATGVEVHGIDASEAMVARLREKPGGDAITVTIGDFSTVPVEGEFALIYVVFNTLFALPTSEEQQQCFANVAARLAPGGVFVVEAFVPDPARFDRGQRVHVEHIAIDHVSLNVAKYDTATQVITSQSIVIAPGKIELRPIVLRIAWPTEIDLMAQLAGLRLRERWGNWYGAPFSDEHDKHISVYERAE